MPVADGLVKEELVIRKIDHEDGRAIRVYLTQKGSGLFEDIWPTIAEAQEEILKDIKTVNEANFLKRFKKILRNIRKHDF